MTPAPRSSHIALAYAALTLAAFSFALNWVIGRALADALSPATLTFCRWAAAATILAPFAARAVRAEWPRLVAAAPRLAVFALLGVGGYNFFAYWGMHYTTAMNGALLNALVPTFIVTLSAIFLRERLSSRGWAGVAVSFVGVAFIITRGHLETLLGLALNLGDLLIIAGVAIWAVYSIALRWRPADLSPMAFLAGTMAFGVLFTGTGAAIEQATVGYAHWSPAVLAGVVTLGLFPSVLAYIGWNYGVARIGASRAGIFSNLIPVFGAALSIVFLGETLGLHHAVGMAAVFAGIWLINQPAPLRATAR